MTMYDFFNSDPYGAHMKAVSLVGYNKKVLEVGCATGQISRRLTANGCEVIGVEIDEERAKEAKKYCRYVILQDVENLDDLLYNNYFDCILFIDVLEHLKYPLIVLEKLKPYLKEDGYVIVSLPNAANLEVRLSLLLGRFEYKDCGILDKSHLRFFDEKGAKKLLEEANFEIVLFDVTPSKQIVPMRSRYSYYLARLRPNLFALQFIMKGNVKKDRRL